MTRTTLNLMSCLVLMTAQAAFAEDETEELVEKVAVRNRLFSVAGRWELGGNVGFSLLTRLTDHYNFNVSVAFNPKDWLGLEVRGGYALSRHTSLAEQIQTDFFTNNTTSKASDAADLWRMSWHAVAGIRLQPVYGKINLMSELPIHFQFYVWLGGGVTGLDRESLVLCPDRAACTSYLADRNQATAFTTETKVSPLVSVALGFRFFVMQQHSVKIEVRDWSYLDSYKVDVTRACQMGVRGCATAADGSLSPNAGITNLVQFDLGYAFIF
ncbi:MAG: outer membrane beta-barrel domain-containing protein [Archangium sp.]|nr:outer membrane beta-barrel domain-containing protein [Archangium sp.]